MKKLWVVLSIAAMLCALLGFTACQGGKDPKPAPHVHTDSAWVQGEEEHYKVCPVCREKYGNATHTFGNDGKCTVCGYSKPAHVHTDSAWVQGEEEHYKVCPVCREKYGNATHTFGNDGKCTVCGYSKPAHVHTDSAWVQGEEEHYKVCPVCHENYGNAAHTFGNDDKCTVCGYPRKVSPLSFEYDEETNGYAVTGIGDETGHDLIVPAMHDGKPVTKIGDGAFFADAETPDTKIRSVSLPASVKTIGANAFTHCQALQTIDLKYVETVGQSAFWDTGVKNADLSAAVAVEAYAFYGDPALATVLIGNGLRTIGQSAFSGCTTLSQVTFGDGLKAIEESAFSGCTSLGEAVFANGLQTIGESAFFNCSALKRVTLPGSITDIGQYAFQKAGIEELDLQDGLDGIGYCSFSRCNALTEVTVPASVTTWGNYAFWSCEALQKVTFANGLKSVGEYAFYQCSALETLSFGGGNIVLKDYAFTKCPVLSRVEIPSVADWCSVSAEDFHGIPFEGGATLYAGGEPVVGTLTIPEGVKKIADYAFWFYQKVDRLVLADSVEEIGKYSFGQMRIYHLTLGKNLKTMRYLDGYNDAYGSFGGFVGYHTWAGIIEIENRSSYTFGEHPIGDVEISSAQECGKLEQRGDFLWYINEKCNRVLLVAYTGEGIFSALPTSSPYGDVYEINRYFTLFSGYGRASRTPFNGENAKVLTEIVRFNPLIIPDCVTRIGDNAFSWEYSTPHFDVIVIGSKVKAIGANAFGTGISKVYKIFFNGTAEAWNKVLCADEAFGGFAYPSQAYFYSAVKQEGSWHYDGNKPVVWA